MTGGTKKLECGHQFHRRCIEPWVRTNDTCPLCRQQISQQKLNELRGIITGGSVIEIEYGRNINDTVGDEDDISHARGNICTIEDEQLQRALSYLVLTHYMRNIDDDFIHDDSTPDTVSFNHIMWGARLSFEALDWSEALVGYQGDTRPPFNIVDQVWDDGIVYERLQISEDALSHWWDSHRDAVIHTFNVVTSRAHAP